MKKKKEIKFTVSNLFWTPETEKEYISFLDRLSSLRLAACALPVLKQ